MNPQAFYESMMKNCTLCPRACGANRANGETGFCGVTSTLLAARAALHFWEEPCISGTSGSGAVFFSGCNMRCSFCQNHSIAVCAEGKELSLSRLTSIFLELQEKGANNINLVTATHYLPQVILALTDAKKNGLVIPIVYNTSGYESTESLKHLEGLVDIYLPDFKYASTETALRFSKAPDYFEVATKAIREMVRQTGPCSFDSETGLMQSGVLVRHLVLPGFIGESKRVLRHLHNTFGDSIYISIMNQYTPMTHLSENPDLQDINRPISADEYNRVLTFAQSIGIQNGYLQEGETNSESFIPPFTYEGL